MHASRIDAILRYSIVHNIPHWNLHHDEVNYADYSIYTAIMICFENPNAVANASVSTSQSSLLLDKFSSLVVHVT